MLCTLIRQESDFIPAEELEYIKCLCQVYVKMFGNKRLRAVDGIALDFSAGSFRSVDLDPLQQSVGEGADQFGAIEHIYDSESNTFAIPTGMVMGMSYQY